MPTNHDVLARIEYIQAEVAALVALLRVDVASSEAVPAPLAPEREAPSPSHVPSARSVDATIVEELPPEPEGYDYSIDPSRAAEILDVARQTVDRRLKEGRADLPGAPRDVSKGAVRSRWRWTSEADVRRWWKAAK